MRASGVTGSSSIATTSPAKLNEGRGASEEPGNAEVDDDEPDDAEVDDDEPDDADDPLEDDSPPVMNVSSKPHPPNHVTSNMVIVPTFSSLTSNRNPKTPATFRSWNTQISNWSLSQLNIPKIIITLNQVNTLFFFCVIELK